MGKPKGSKNKPKTAKANLFISVFFLQAAKWVLVPLNATPHISQVLVFLTAI